MFFFSCVLELSIFLLLYLVQKASLKSQGKNFVDNESFESFKADASFSIAALIMK